MDNALAKRGKLVDDLQYRISQMKLRGKVVPKEWHEKLKKLAEASDAKDVDDVEKWSRDLPPAELQTAEMNWQAVAHFTGMTLVSLSAHHTIATVLKQKKLVTNIEKLIQDIAALKDDYDDAAAAYDAFKTMMAEFTEANPKLSVGV